MPREIPILFSTPMVRANRAGLKWQTRRAMKSQPATRPFQVQGDSSQDWFTENREYPQRGPMMAGRWRCPYGRPGDVLWSREAFYLTSIRSSEFGIGYRADHPTGNLADSDGGYNFRSFSDDPEQAGLQWDWAQRHAGAEKWIPSIHMPRWASRDTYVITEVRVERLQDISEADAVAEGIIRLPASGRYVINQGGQYLGDVWFTAKAAYHHLYECINGPGSWDRNDFVWVITYDNPARKGGA